jgi:hypothetical protein
VVVLDRLARGQPQRPIGERIGGVIEGDPLRGRELPPAGFLIRTMKK